MEGILGKFAPQIYAIMRIVIGLLFAMHGTQKLLGWPARTGGGGPRTLSALSLTGAWIELVAGIAIAIGLFASVAAFLASGQMAVAYFLRHAGEGGFWPLQNRGELAVVYCFIFLYIAAAGSGVWSVDALRRGRTARSAL